MYRKLRVQSCGKPAEAVLFRARKKEYKVRVEVLPFEEFRPNPQFSAIDSEDSTSFPNRITGKNFVFSF